MELLTTLVITFGFLWSVCMVFFLRMAIENLSNQEKILAILNNILDKLYKR